MNKNEIVEYVKSRIANKENEILDEVSKSVAYWVLTGCKYEIDYTENLPYDHSGEINRVDEQLDKNMYETLGDFLEEYTGNKYATYCSGCGWGYDTYEKEIEYIVRELIYPIVEECFNEIKESSPESINALTGLVLGEDDEYEIYEAFDDYLYGEDIDAQYYIEEWKDLKFKDIFKRGEFAAKRQIEEERKALEYRRSKDAEYKILAEKLFDKYVSLCGPKIEFISKNDSRYIGHQFGKRKDVLGYLDKVTYNSIKDILNSNFTKKELAILSKYKLITTNSVELILEKGIDLYKDAE